MAAWQRSWKTDLALRLGGATLLAVAWMALDRLSTMHLAPHDPGFLAYGLAAIGFLCASAGSAMVSMGGHLFDQVEISARWRRSGTAMPKGRSRDRL